MPMALYLDTGSHISIATISVPIGSYVPYSAEPAA
jgi:hypothetical protein